MDGRKKLVSVLAEKLKYSIILMNLDIRSPVIVHFLYLLE